jgi:hypothetical protein
MMLIAMERSLLQPPLPTATRKVCDLREIEELDDVE